MSITPLYNLSLHFIEQGNSGISPLESIRAFHKPAQDFPWLPAKPVPGLDI